VVAPGLSATQVGHRRERAAKQPAHRQAARRAGNPVRTVGGANTTLLASGHSEHSIRAARSGPWHWGPAAAKREIPGAVVVGGVRGEGRKQDQDRGDGDLSAWRAWPSKRSTMPEPYTYMS